MAATAHPASRPAGSEAHRTARAAVPQPAPLRPSRERRPGGASRPAAKPTPARARRRPPLRRGSRVGDRVRAARPAVLLDRLLRGRAWVALIAVLLTGIVFLNVALLEINGSIARMDARAAALKRENADLRMRVARLGSSERIRRAAAAEGFVAAAPGDVGYLVPRADDASAAARALEGWETPRPAPPGDRSAATTTSVPQPGAEGVTPSP